MPLTIIQSTFILIGLFWLLGEVRRCKRIGESNLTMLKRIEEKVDALAASADD